MANRFVRRIRDGQIETPEALKAEFKALAKSTHPDLAGPGAEREFIRVREEYEAALRDFGRHRFGVRGAADAERPEMDAFAALGLLRKRGFPKTPRHEKEILRYEYARWCCIRALSRIGERAAEGFVRFERSMLEAKAGRPDEEAVAADALLYLDALVEYAALGMPALRTALLIELGSLRAKALLAPDALEFLSELSASLGIGSALPPS